jgi:SPP1 gp7 family putative phage head morphogenesis protein
MKAALFYGLVDSDAMAALYRLDSQAVVIPFRDSVIAGLQEIAIAGAEFGREQVERHVFWVKAVGPNDIPLPVASGAALAIDWQLANNAAAEWARRYGYELVRGMNDTTRQRLQREIVQFVQNEESLPDLIERLEDVFGPVRAEIVGVTEVTRAYQQGSLASWRQSGMIQKKEVRTANDELVCPICGPKNGKQYDLDDTDGDSPFHPRCRCWSVPVVVINEAMTV